MTVWDSGAAHRARRIVGRSRLWLRCRDLLLRSGRGNFLVVREDLARRYLQGSGIEIGPMTTPLRLPPGVHVRYVDRHTREELLESEGEHLAAVGIDPSLIPAIDVVDDAARFAHFADDAVDFVIANHVLEHMEDPIEHLVLDHEQGPQRSREQHYAEWARIIEGVAEKRVGARVAEFAAVDARHHFHVWELEGFLPFLLAAHLPCEVIHAQTYLKEFAVVLRGVTP